MILIWADAQGSSLWNCEGVFPFSIPLLFPKKFIFYFLFFILFCFVFSFFFFLFCFRFLLLVNKMHGLFDFKTAYLLSMLIKKPQAYLLLDLLFLGCDKKFTIHWYQHELELPENWLGDRSFENVSFLINF